MGETMTRPPDYDETVWGTLTPRERAWVLRNAAAIQATNEQTRQQGVPIAPLWADDEAD